MTPSTSNNLKRGQVFVLIIVVMLVALSIGVTMSSRLLSTQRIQTRTDDSVKAQNAAEAGIEKALAIPYSTLVTYAQTNSCGANCMWEITDSSGKKLSATITLQNLGNSAQTYALELDLGHTEELNLEGHAQGKRVDVCWNNEASIYGNYTTQGGGDYSTAVYAYNSVGSPYNGNGFSSSTAANGYSSCFSLIVNDQPVSMRLRAYYVPTTVYIVAVSNAEIPQQGVEITSTGVFGESVRKIKVIKTEEKAPAVFDYVIYQKSTTDPLSNK